MTGDTMTDRNALADRIERREESWLPTGGLCKNVTFSLDECEVLLAALRQAPSSASPRAPSREEIIKAMCCPGGCVRDADDCWADSQRDSGKKADAILALRHSIAEEPREALDPQRALDIGMQIADDYAVSFRKLLELNGNNP